MIVIGERTSFVKTLADYLMSKETNEAVFIREIEHYPDRQLSLKNLKNALGHMDTQALAKGKKRSLYHAIIALADGEKLSQEQLKFAVDTLAANLGFTHHQRVVIEHWKNGRQHFHIVCNMINPTTGTLARLDFSRLVQLRVQNELNQKFGFKSIIHKGQRIHHWEYRRGERSGINPCHLRKAVTLIFKTSRTGAEFVASLARAGCVLSLGRHNSYVIVDKAGDMHGLMSRIEGARSADLEKKFPDLKNITLPPLDAVRQRLRKTFPRKKITRDCRAATRLLKRDNLRARAPALYRPAPSKSLRKTGPAPLLAIPRRPGQRKGAEALAYAPLPRGKAKIHVNGALQANFPDPEFERAELIAWAFRNGRFDILAQFGIFCAPEAP